MPPLPHLRPAPAWPPILLGIDSQAAPGCRPRPSVHQLMSRATQDLLAQTVIEQQAEVAILSEPYKDKHEGVWQRSSDGRAAIWSCGQPPGHLSQRETHNNQHQRTSNSSSSNTL
nr:uncharacterized protein LOC118879114 [Drosophila suzukii]XP_036678154.1 uncharacterized protein LOC118879394 [Drosophila suzukii]